MEVTPSGKYFKALKPACAALAVAGDVPAKMKCKLLKGDTK